MPPDPMRIMRRLITRPLIIQPLNIQPLSARRNILLLPILTVITVLSLAAPDAGAQDYNAKMRALNLARNTAIKINGGLSKYVPDKCMFNSELPVGICLVRRDASGFYYRFVGGEPGWQVLGKVPNTETLIQISSDGQTVVNIEYNGPLTIPPPNS